jgi:tRNA-specific 2-thiouridylase
MEHSGKKICVAMSGGVDSSVAAHLLAAAGNRLIGVTMCLGVTDEAGRAACCGPQAVRDARTVCDQLDMPHYVLDFSKLLQEHVINDFLSQYAAGRTPNPCVRCNRYLKFDALYKYARSCGYDYIATGHYAAIGTRQGRTVLLRHHDRGKDQSYFLYSIPPEVLEYTVFPLAGMAKPAVRAVARESRITVAEKPESQEICFVTDNDYRRFLKQYGIPAEEGPFIDTAGRVLGTHKGIFNYTIGQRKGLGIALGAPCYVVTIDPGRNTVTLGTREELGADSLVARDVNLFVDELPAQCTAKIRYAQADVPCSARYADGRLTVTFGQPVEAVTPGQSVVLYDGDAVLGGGIIEDVIRSKTS